MRLPIAGGVGLLVFAALGLEAHATPYFSFDPPVTEAVQGQAWIGPLAVLGSLVPVLLLVSLPLLWFRRSRAVAVIVGAGVLLAGVIGEAVKQGVSRPRPDLPSVKIFEEATGFGYPSGAIVLDAAFIFLLAFALSSDRGSSRVLTWSAAAIASILLVVARIYSGVHWPSDVLGGLLLGASVAAIVWSLARPRLPLSA
jgi:membrane-associated phospholipid phosphatase